MNIVITDNNFVNDEPERKVLQSAGLSFVKYNCKTVEEMIEAGRRADAVIVQFAPVTKEVLEAWTSCKLIVRYGIGYDNVDVKTAEELGITVCNVPSYCLDEVADHTCALILACSRKIVLFHESVCKGEWNVQKVAKRIPPLSEMTLGLVGFGRIGARVAERLKAFRFQIMIFDPYLNDDQAIKFGVAKASSFEELLSKADIFTLHSPLTTETHHMINEKTLSLMKEDAWVINTSRGGLIDTVALARSLREGRLGGAALDVFEQEPLTMDHPLRSCGNVILSPHAAYYSDKALNSLQEQAAEEVVRLAQGQPLASVVNHPKQARLKNQ